MDSASYISGRLTAYFQNNDNAQKAQEELLGIGVPSSGVVLQSLKTGKEDAQDALNRLFGSEFGPYDEGSILTIDDPSHGTQILAIVERYGGRVQVRGAQEDTDVDSPATDTQSSGNP
jgi:hypothetical protein